LLAKAAEGILVDYGKGERPIGIEITAPKQISRQAIVDRKLEKNSKILLPAD